MGKIFLIAIAAGIVWTGSVIWSWFQVEPRETPEVITPAPEVTGSRIARPIQEDAQGNEGSSSVATDESRDEWLPWPVLARSEEWVFIEGWGKVQKGGELPCGGTLEGWSDRNLIVRTDQGKQPQRIRNVLQALKEVAGTLATAAPDQGVAEIGFLGAGDDADK